ncbi:chromosome transmission fidelity protein 18 homolog isoform X1 [Zingiber officinale]|uniref:chromosome transmission fidelity protein 18 homolog isoform X1 n=1 Tax=Zingiber officinale TaxID=94328 RepID=UPI001C4BD148|nr:chromosome transmission fidelity protein 18 homolog isoform X1 [Zingiber officinale]
MEMDFPAAEELEYLESNSIFPDEDGEDFFEKEEGDTAAAFDDLNFDESAAGGQIPHQDRLAAKNLHQEITKKRLWLAEDESEENLDHEARAKRIALEDESDEDWLRYSPQREAVSDVLVAEEKILSRFSADIEGQCMPVTAPSGARVYAKMSSAETGGGRGEFMARKERGAGLLSEPISALNKKMEQEALAKALKDSFGSADKLAHATINQVDEQLWVDKYSPNSFKELLSDERTNREVLLWLKQWDSSVFGSHITATEDEVLSALRRHSSGVQNPRFGANRSFFHNKGHPFGNRYSKISNFSDGQDSHFIDVHESSERKTRMNHAPEQKVLLLCGSPGLGKTTLANIAAKHCGYRAVEINASDDRSASTVESKILDVIQMNSVMPDAKPKCLIIDEIDGALGEGKGVVDVILKMIAAEKKLSSDKENSTHQAEPGKTMSKKRHKSAILNRPVICICNDVYAPALRALRQVAKVHTFVQPTINRVVNRLNFICAREGFRTNKSALSALAEYTDCDIRSCLNTLQFLHKKKETLNISDISSQVVGRKDISRSTVDVWKEVFQKSTRQGERKFNNGGCEHGVGDFEFVYSLVSNCGEYELTMDGIHENFPRLSYHDPMMRKTVKCLNMLGISDSLLQYVLRTQQMSLLAYQPPLVISMSQLIAQVEKPNIEWPRTFHRCRSQLVEKKELLKTWLTMISPSISRHLSIMSFVEDIVSPLLHILSPPSLRPVSSHLLSEREKDDLCQLVDTMVSLSIMYKSSKADPPEKSHKYGSSIDVVQLTIDPPLHDYANFKEYQSQHFVLSGAIQQILVHEVDKYRILRDSTVKSVNQVNENNNRGPDLANVDFGVTSAKKALSVTYEDDSKTKMSIDQIQNLASGNISVGKKSFSCGSNSRPLKKSSNNASSFFSRFRNATGSSAKNASTTIERDSWPLIFKYNEGFTNAVKRPVRIRDLLL